MDTISERMLNRWLRWLRDHPNVDVEAVQRDAETQEFFDDIIPYLDWMVCASLNFIRGDEAPGKTVQWSSCTGTSEVAQLESELVGAVVEMVESECAALDWKAKAEEYKEKIDRLEMYMFERPRSPVLFRVGAQDCNSQGHEFIRWSDKYVQADSIEQAIDKARVLLNLKSPTFVRVEFAHVRPGSARM